MSHVPKMVLLWLPAGDVGCVLGLGASHKQIGLINGDWHRAEQTGARVRGIIYVKFSWSGWRSRLVGSNWRHVGHLMVVFAVLGVVLVSGPVKLVMP